MLDIGMTELLLIGIVALIVVGPKDLPGMFRTLGRFTARARQLGRQFTQAMNEAADQSGMKDAADGLKAAANPRKFGMDKLNEAATNFEKWDPSSRSGKADVEDDPKPAPTEADAERAEDIRKIREKNQAAGQAKLDAAKAAEAEAETPVKKPAAKKAPAKKPAAKKAPAKKPAAKKPAAKAETADTSAKKPTKKPAAKKPAAKKAPAKKAPAKKAPAKKASPE